MVRKRKTEMISELFARFDRGVGKRLCMDPINDLHETVIEEILARLPIRDAIRTSVLSRKWRYRWSTLSNLVFDGDCVTPDDDPDLLEEDLVRFITLTLLLHQGPIHKFKLSALLQRCHPDVDQWLLFLSRNDIQELVLELDELGDSFSVPSCLFNCEKLTRLELCHCDKFKPPKHFKGFPSLRSLRLDQVTDVDPEVMERLISGCPLLEDLTLTCSDILCLHIWAPNLKCLVLSGEFRDVLLKNTPKLLEISVLMCNLEVEDDTEYSEQSSGCNLDKFLSGAPLLEKLVSYDFFTEYLSLGDDPGRLPIFYMHLKTIELDQVCFADASKLLLVLRLITCSPNLRELKLLCPRHQMSLPEEDDLYIWKKAGRDCKLPTLKFVRMKNVSGLRNEFDFIRFLLRNSPVLETFAIRPFLPDLNARRDMLVKLLEFRRASPQAQVSENLIEARYGKCDNRDPSTFKILSRRSQQLCSSSQASSVAIHYLLEHFSRTASSSVCAHHSHTVAVSLHLPQCIL